MQSFQHCGYFDKLIRFTTASVARRQSVGCMTVTVISNVIQILYVGLAVNGMSVLFVVNPSDSDSKTVKTFVRTGQSFGGIITAGKRKDSRRCGVSGVHAACPKAVVSTSLRTAGRAGGANCTCLGRFKLPMALVF